MGKKRYNNAALPVTESKDKEELELIITLVGKRYYDGRMVYSNWDGEVESIFKFKKQIEKFRETKNAKYLFE